MRLFAAVLPSPEAAGPLAELVQRLRARPGADRLRWTDPAGWHVTVAFHGEVAEDRVPELHRGLARAAADCPPFTLRLSGGGRFGDRHLWAGVDGERDSLAGLAAGAAGAANGVGGADGVGGATGAVGGHPYVPHLTLARGSGREPLAPWTDALSGYASASWQVSELVLMSSRLPHDSSGGPHYLPVAAWPLGG
ncbi:RNA 2',3'-cyclic phosphodiesterase [Streptomyces sp. 549]|uniref:RNA 2',3'-cyclic phosphodiesterase n=1 Tax=Streptomyces sp. 549 TaxID=3049076 RepID=UPI0024C44C71|nr:RNA 2',3'-cyclic phosphodiesterase [Streptomyces sp. 549]MDK1472532.1 RNA 2',3'-cyclic phosphodiesterase [Streptomyces sp. 549]